MNIKKVLKFIAGFLLVAIGIGLVIKNWIFLAAIINALGGVIIALIGLVMMFSASLK